RGKVGHEEAPGTSAAAAALAAAGRASAMREIAASSCAAPTNQHSNALGGRYTPASSIAWKNGRYRNGSAAWASAKLVTAEALKNTEKRLPAYCTRCGTP